jgi:hypothetical protein
MPARRKTPSPCSTGKFRYRDELSAKIALANTQRPTSSRREEARVYRCPSCRGYHLTSLR